MPLTEKLSLGEALAEISKMPVASLEGVFALYAGNPLFHDLRSTASVSLTNAGSEIARLLLKEQLTVETEGKKVAYYGPGALDGRLRATKVSLPDGVVSYSMAGQVWQNRRMYHFNLTVSTVKR